MHIYRVFLLIVIFFGVSCTEELPLQMVDSNNWKIIVISDTISQISGSSALVSGFIDSTNAENVILRGVCYDTSPNPTIDKNKVENGFGKGSFSCNLIELEPNRKYYARAYAKTDYTSFYGEEKAFFTLDGLPKLDSSYASEVTQTSALITTSLLDDGGFPIVSMGICYSRTSIPTNDSNNVVTDSTTGIFKCQINGLSYNTLYYIRSFAINKQGIVYGSLDSVLTSPGKPTVKTTEVIAGATKAIVLGVLESDGGSSITELGFCYGLNENPGLEDKHIKLHIDIHPNEMNGELIGLLPNTTYYVRAYAINEFGVAFGSNRKFITLTGLANVITYKPRNITVNSALLSAFVCDNLGGELINYGFYFAETENPSVTDQVISFEGKICGDFSYPIEGLKENTIYYYRVFGQTNTGMSYGQVQRFFTNNLPVEELEFVTVEGGTFIMGSNEDANQDNPEHEVIISSFQMSAKEVSYNQFLEFIIANPPNSGNYYYLDNGVSAKYWYTFEDCGIGYNVGFSPYFEMTDYADSPNCSAAFITWYGAQAYCKWVGGRLPTEAEWEYAAKGGNLSNGYTFSGSNNLEDVAWNGNNAGNKIHQSGLKVPNELGLFDMTGNLNEHCIDWYNPDYYSYSPYSDPLNVLQTGYTVIRGGSWLNANTDSLEIPFRSKIIFENYDFPQFNPVGTGFRVVKDIEK
jgi:formylglycine-generating enzyme required for sulfatase activity